MIEVFGRANSINVQKVMWCAYELRLDVQRHDVGGAFSKIDTPEFKAMNPNGQIPVLKDGEFVIWESNAIVRYLCDRYNRNDWQPDCSMKRGTAHQWMDWYLTTLHPPMTTVFWQLIRTASEDRNVQEFENAINTSAHLWTMLDSHFSTNNYILGDQISMADIPLGCSAYRWYSMNVDRPDLKHLKRWYYLLSERAAFRSQVMHPLT